jgi:hypothetical protein
LWEQIKEKRKEKKNRPPIECLAKLNRFEKKKTVQLCDLLHKVCVQAKGGGE